jgi:glyoxalase family protein
MENILGIHHVTAIAGSANRNHEFYTHVLGLRLVKKTVNFDDPTTYHLYYGDTFGSPGTILTFFPWEGIKQGKSGNGMGTEINYVVPKDSLAFWRLRLTSFNVLIVEQGERFSEEYLSFLDPDGLLLTLIASLGNDQRVAWETEEIKSSVATKGFHSVTLHVSRETTTASILTEIFQYRFIGKEGTRSRYRTDSVEYASVIDIIENPNGKLGVNAGGTIHHVAFRVKDEATQQMFRERIVSHGLNITDKIDRNYFFSLYFREPGGVLFEIATDNPGFSVDEPVNELGEHLKLPLQYEDDREKIEASLPKIN